MRHLIKLLILVIIAFGAMMVYGIFDFQMGFARSASDLSESMLLLTKNIKYLGIGDDRYFVSFVVDNKLYTGICSSDSASLLVIFESLKGGTSQELSFTSAIIFGILFIVVLFFPTRRRKKAG